jgi:hypothetical protein
MEEKQRPDPGAAPADSGTNPGAAPAKRPQTEPAASVERTFKRTYIGDHGIFIAGESYPLTREQREALAEDLE